MIPMPNRASPVWTDAELLECVAVLPEAPNVKTFSFRAPSGATFVYKAGQFITLDLPVPGGNVQRTFTMSSSPLSAGYISVTVKVQEGSVGSRWMHDHLTIGTRIKAYGPAGIFHLPDQPDGKYLYISAGSGVTPLMSMATTLYELGNDPDVCFIECAKRPRDLIFRQKLELMTSRTAGIDLHFVVGQNDPYEVWTGYRGRFNQLMLGLMCQDYLERDVYCCGPESFMDSVREILISLGYDMDRYHQEAFSAPVEDEKDLPEFNDVEADATAAAEVTFAKSGKTATGKETDTVLALARANGVPLPSGCSFGLCGTCKIKKISGDVHMVHNGGITDAEVDAGYILACCSHPLGTVEVEA